MQADEDTPGEVGALFPIGLGVWGEPMPNYSSIVPGVLAIYESRLNNDPVNQALLRLKYFPAQPARTIRGVKLTDQQYDDYTRVAGRTAKMRLNAVVGQRGFDLLPPERQVDLVRHTIQQAREIGRNYVLMSNPSVVNAAIAAKTARLHGVPAVH